MTRVLLVGKGPPEQGGIASFLDDLLTSDLAREHDLRFLNVAHTHDREGGRLSGGNLRRTAGDAVAVWRASGDREVVHVHSALAPTVTLLRAGVLAAAARARGCHAVVHVHGGRLQLWLTSRWRRRVARLALGAASQVVTVSEGATTSLLTALDARRVRHVDNGVDLEVFRPATVRPTGSSILFVGGLTPRKGVLDLFAALASLEERGVRPEVRLVGGMPDEGPAAEQEVRAAAPDGVRFLGTRARADMPAVYQGAGIFCLPSWWEAMPLSVLEAMASGLPVVATDVGDVARLVEHGVTGYVVPPRDPASLADALGALLGDAAMAREMGAAGRRRAAERFASTTTVRGVSAVYHEVAGHR